MLDIRLELVDGSTVLFCIGRLIAGEDSRLLQAVTEARPGSSLLLDLGLVEDVDAGGLGSLVEVQRILELKGVELLMVNMQPQVEQMVRLTGLDRVLPIVEQRQLCRAAC
jgi:anti-anti-sigma factor